MSTRRPLVSGNWKMHHDHIEALHTVRDLGLRLKPEDVAAVDVSVHPPFTDLRTVQTLVEKEHIPRLSRGAALLGRGRRGAHGEISPRMLARLGTAYVLVGHSERRTLFGMDDATVAATLRAVLRHEMMPVVLRRGDPRNSATPVTPRACSRSRCWRPSRAWRRGRGGSGPGLRALWAIGTGRAAVAVDAEDACVFIRSLVAKVGGDDAAASGEDPIRRLGERRERRRSDGRARRGRPAGGGASLEAAAFTDIIRATAACYRS